MTTLYPLENPTRGKNNPDISELLKGEKETNFQVHCMHWVHCGVDHMHDVKDGHRQNFDHCRDPVDKVSSHCIAKLFLIFLTNKQEKLLERKK